MGSPAAGGARVRPSGVWSRESRQSRNPSSVGDCGAVVVVGRVDVVAPGEVVVVGAQVVGAGGVVVDPTAKVVVVVDGGGCCPSWM